MLHALLIIVAPLAAAVVVFLLLLWWGTRWGSTPDERRREMAGDDYIADGPRVRATMTRALSLEAPPEQVWPWLAQLGRGAGWYSYDRLDNAGKRSAEHIVSWVPEPAVGDASAIGYLRHVAPGREITWWLGGDRFLGMMMRMVTSLCLDPDEVGSRLVIRISGDIRGFAAWPLMLLFKFVDSIMARRQLIGIRKRVESYGGRTEDPARHETGDRDQFQLYHVIYADGKEAGVPGKEKAPRWRRSAIESGLINE